MLRNTPDFVTIEGNLFNRYFENICMYSLISKSMEANRCKFKKGLNIYNYYFYSSNNCSTGIMFLLGDNISFWKYNFFESYDIWNIEIPNDAQVAIRGKQMKTDKIILKSICEENDVKKMTKTDVEKLFETNMFLLSLIGYELSCVNTMSLSCPTEKNICLLKQLDRDNKKAYVIALIISNYDSNRITKSMLNEAIEYYPIVVGFIPTKLLTTNMCKKAWKLNKYIFDELPQEFLDQELCDDAVRWCEKMSKYVPEKYKTKLSTRS
jgi:hypothetical protein